MAIENFSFPPLSILSVSRDGERARKKKEHVTSQAWRGHEILVRFSSWCHWRVFAVQSSKRLVALCLASSLPIFDRPVLGSSFPLRTYVHMGAQPNPYPQVSNLHHKDYSVFRRSLSFSTSAQGQLTRPNQPTPATRSSCAAARPFPLFFSFSALLPFVAHKRRRLLLRRRLRRRWWWW